MDELEISGKRYISARRAAKEHHYHSDYIGQLIRSGKVVGQKVGRSWYVDESSLLSYLNKEAPSRPSIEVEVAEEAKVEEAEKAEELASEIVEEESPKEITPAVIEEIIEEEAEVQDTAPEIGSEEISIPIKKEHEEKIPLRIEEDTAQKNPGLIYVRDDSSMLPTVESKSAVIHRMPRQAAPSEFVTPSQMSVGMRGTLLLVALGLVIFFTSAAVSTKLASMVGLAEGNEATVSYSFEW